MSVLDPKADAAAIAPIVQQFEQNIVTGLSEQVAPAIGQALQNALDGLEVSIQISIKKKGSS